MKKACSGKRRYCNRKSAWHAAALVTAKHGVVTTPYRCSYCSAKKGLGRFHLTTKHQKNLKPAYSN